MKQFCFIEKLVTEILSILELTSSASAILLAYEREQR